ncbi:MAG: hypothetical protein ACM3X9_15250 [Bacillota bacterium]
MRLFLLIISLSIFFLTYTPKTIAGIDVSNTATFKNNIITENVTLDGTLCFYGKINEAAIGYAGIRYITSATDFKKVDFSIDYCYFNYKTKPDFGTFTVGSFSYPLGNLFILNSAIPELESIFGVKWERTIIGNLSAKIGVFPQEYNFNTANKKPYKTVSTIGLNYSPKNFGADFNLIQPGDYELCYTVNTYFKPVKIITLYGHYGIDHTKDIEEIVGFYVDPRPKIPLVFYAEYNLDNEPVDANRLGYRLRFILDKNIEMEYIRAFSTTDLNEFRFTVSW